MRVLVTENIKAFKVRNAKHVVYAHQNSKGEVYIGQSNCIVNRWNEHILIARSVNHPEHEQRFKKSLREFTTWIHYIIGYSDTQSEADDIEAAAIEFYKPKLNSHPGRGMKNYEAYDFRALEKIGREITLDATEIIRYRNQERFSDRERTTITCKAVTKIGKSHVSFQCIKDGFHVHISHEKRKGFKSGDIVTISFAAKGTRFYTTKNDSEIKLKHFN